MEYALRFKVSAARCMEIGLNPCFNGICSAIQCKTSRWYDDATVLILVLMEYALRSQGKSA